MTATQVAQPATATKPIEEKKRLRPVKAGYKCVQCRGPLKNDKTLCAACRGVFYCSKDCQVKHWRANHKIACQLYRHILSKPTTKDLPFTFPLRVKPNKYEDWLEARGVLDKGLWRRESRASAAYAYGQLPETKNKAEAWALPESALPAPLAKPLAKDQPEFPSEPLTDWKAYYEFRQLPLDSPIAVLLSVPLTLYYIISQCLPEKYRKRKELRIHILGAESELDQTPVLAELANLIPNTKFHITFIGPSVYSDMHAPNPHPRVQLAFRRGLYHELTQEEGKKKLHPADFAVAFNASLETSPDWRPTVRQLVQQKVPSFFTEQTETSTLNATRLFAIVGAREAFPVRLNPFRSPVWREAEVHLMPCYSNGFLQAINL
jgi:hypothetical protein